MAQPNTPLTLGSLFSGSGGFELGGILAGIRPVWNCEVEPFPIRVTTKRLPQVKHYGDISKLDGTKLEPVDIITGGFPCQSTSCAGKREGIQHIEHGGKKTTRSGLFYEAVRIVKEMRRATNGEKPRFFVVENVLGLFSSKEGEDFKTVLQEIIAVAEPEAPPLPMPEKRKWAAADVILGDGWSVAYRTLDAQYFGVPQRRKRIFLVADFAGQSAPKVLFESEGFSGYSAAGFRAWQRAASCAESGAGTAGGSGGAAGSGGTSGRSGGIAEGIVLNDQGGACMDVSRNVTGTLRAQEHGHPPCVIEAAGFCTEHSANARSIGYEEERSPTLRAGVVPAAIALENHPTDSRVKMTEDGVVQTLPARMGTGGGNVPLLMEREAQETAMPDCGNSREAFVPFVKGTRPHSPEEAPTWKQGETANTLNTFDVGERRCNELAVKAYGICSKASHAMLSDNPHSGFYEAETSRTLDQNGGRPDCAQGGVCICEPEDGVYAMTTGSYMHVEKEVSPTLMARDFKDPTSIAPVPCGVEPNLQDAKTSLQGAEPVLPEVCYTVRRLTPAECARLQGFPDDWCHDLGTENPTDEEIAFWSDVFETHRRLVTHAKKPKTEKQIRKWLADPYSDAAEYKLWGNGLCLPISYFVLSGIVWASQLDTEKQ